MIDSGTLDRGMVSHVAAHFRDLHEPAIGRVHHVRDLARAPDGQFAFTGAIYRQLGGLPDTIVGLLDRNTGVMSALRRGGRRDRLPRFSSDGRYLAFLSEGDQRGHFQLCLWDRAAGCARPSPCLPGIVENFLWSPHGAAILLQTAEAGADAAGTHGSGVVGTWHDPGNSWMPDVETAVPSSMWRRLWTWQLVDEKPKQALPDGLNVWEACWCGVGALVAVVSDNPREGEWYRARLVSVELQSGSVRTLYAPQLDQIGIPSASPSGRFAAFVEACCSDRALVAGDVILLDLASNVHRRIDTQGVDVTHLHWLSESRLFFIGVRGFESVAGEFDLPSRGSRITWTTHEHCGPVKYPEVTPVSDAAFAVVLESYKRFPCIAMVERGETRVLHDFAHEGARRLIEVNGELEEMSWRGQDGLEIQGYLAVPRGAGPHATIVLVHGGPVSCFRNCWSMGYLFTPLLVKAGYAVFHPNPRGSSARGQAFARRVRGDLCGEDGFDILAGLQKLIERGVTDPARVAITGRSYGGAMASWLITQFGVFTAAVPMAPTTNWYSQHLTSNIPDFDRLFLGSDLEDPHGPYHSRSSVMFASRVTTPTLHIAGARDRCTPPTQALEFHRALVERGVASECVIYPEEGHHVNCLEAQIDLCSRMLSWFHRYCPARPAS